MNPLAIIVTCCIAAAILWLPRKHALTPLILGVVFLPPYNAVSIGSINLPALRLLLLCLLIRMLVRNEAHPIPGSKLDRYVMIWAVWMTISYLALTFNASAIINRMGTVWVDLVLAYFLCRRYMTDLPSIVRTGYVLVGVTCALAISTSMEYFKG